MAIETRPLVAAYLWSEGGEYEDKRVEIEIQPNEADPTEIVLGTLIDGEGWMAQYVLSRDAALRAAKQLLEAAGA